MSNIAVITGATRGLGFETARLLGQSGVKVVLGARDLDTGEKASQRLGAEGIDAEAVRLDVTVSATVQAAAEEVAERHGRIDILVNNAGILPEATAPSTGDRTLDLALYRTTFDRSS
jgi:NAD(P)-dependent dehydrogenase (short-subunit alcohol dehydrogenase family)